jgi:hypothetical protein
MSWYREKKEAGKNLRPKFILITSICQAKKPWKTVYAENARCSYHGGGGPPYDSRLSTQTVAEFYRRRSKPNLDKSECAKSASSPHT